MNECKIKLKTDVSKSYVDISAKGMPLQTVHKRSNLSPTVYVDGEPIDLKAVGLHNNTEGVFKTEKDTVEITMTKRFMMESKHWFWMNLLFFFVSIFGIFDAGDGRRFQTYTYTAILHLTGSNTIEVAINRFVDGQRALEVHGDCVIEETANKFFVRKDLRKRRRRLNLLKAVIWIALIVAAAILIALAIVK